MLFKAALLAALGASTLASPVARSTSAPTFNYPGDAPYPMSAKKMASYIDCPSSFKPNQKIIALYPGTGSTGQESWHAAYLETLPANGFSNLCVMTFPNRTLGDAQDSGALAAYSFHYISKLAGGKPITVIGHSQGNLNIQWGLTFWPSTRAAKGGPVDQFISLAGDFHGTTEGALACTSQKITEGGCVPSVIQQTAGSNFLNALAKHGGTNALTNTTSIYTIEDDVISPESPPSQATSRLGSTRGGKDLLVIAIQTPCPTSVSDHLLLLVNGPAFTIAKDALVHGGVAKPSRFPANICLSTTQMDPNSLNTLKATFNDLQAVATGDGIKLLKTEPPLKAYAK